MISSQLLSNSLAAINHCRIYIETSNDSSMDTDLSLSDFEYHMHLNGAHRKALNAYKQIRILHLIEY
ncbi:hypothetical protein LENED_010315 [Lentinula edodes]|uniref:Uncharacterized protein n=1 Tax=Lentinula edodes TaxID=5353 RepID=A0A1Q3EM24_LENED|nr:hypothetical protein LENED_010315 [Lentinula edodes]